MKTRLSAGLCVLGYFLCSVSALADSLDRVDGFLIAGKYVEAEKILAVELSAKKPSDRVMRLGVKSAEFRGEFITANRRISVLLSRAPADPDLLYQAAELAELSGDPSMALDRYALFIRTQNQKSERLMRAFLVLLPRRASPEAYRKLIALYGDSSSSWSLGWSQIRRAKSTMEGELALELISPMFQTFKKETQTDTLTTELRSLITGRLVSAKDGLPVMLQAQTLEAKAALEILGWSGLKGEAYLTQLYAVIKRTGATSKLSIISSDRELSKLSLERRVALARGAYELMPLYAKASPYRHREYLRWMAEKPEFFRNAGQVVVSEAAMVQHFAEVAARYPDSPRSLGYLARMIVERYLSSKEARVAFMKAHIHSLEATSGGVQKLLEWTDAKNVGEVIRQVAGTDKGYEFTLQGEFLSFYAKNKDKAGLFAATRNYLMSHPGDFDGKRVWTYFVQSGLGTIVERMRVLAAALVHSGVSPTHTWLAGEMQKDEEAMKAVAAQVYVKAVASNRVGTDPVARAAVLLAGIKENRRDPDPRVYKTVKACLDQYKGAPLGPIQTPADLALHHLFHKHYSHVFDHKTSVEEFAVLWTPLMGRTDNWKTLMGALSRHRLWDGVTAMLPRYLSLIDKGWKGDETTWNHFFERGWIKVPADSKASPLGNYYTYVSAERGLEHISGLPYSAYPNELLKLHRQWAYGTWPRAYQDAVIRRLNGDARAKNIVVPQALSDLLWKHYVVDNREGIYRQYPVIEMLRYAGRPNIASGVLAASQTRTARECLDLLTRCWGFFPSEAAGAPPAAGHRLYIAINEYKTALDAVAVDVLGGVGLSAYMIEGLSGETYPADVAPAVDALCARMTELLSNGVVFSDSIHSQLRATLYLLRRAIKANDVATVASLSQVMARTIWRDSNWNYMKGSLIDPLQKALGSDLSPQILVGFIRTLQLHSNMPADVKNSLSAALAQASRGIVGMYPVGPDDPSYDLYVASDLLAQKNMQKAWQLTEPKLKLLLEIHLKLDKRYVVWCAEKMRQQGLLSQSLELCRHVLLKEFAMRPEDAALFILTKGDIYRDRKDYPMAKIEYEGIRNSKRYARTVAGRMAGFRLVELLIHTNNYTEADPLIERLQTHGDPDVQAQGHYYAALLAFEQQEYKEAWSSLETCFDLKFDHSEGRLLLGRLKVITKRGLDDPDIAVGVEGEREKLVPGRQLPLRLKDRQRAASGGGQVIPVIVRTLKGKDVERVSLLQSGSDPTLFKAFLPTRMGTAAVGNMHLEVLGGETVTYEIDPEFKKRRSLPDYPAHRLLVVDDGRLAASAGEILTEEEVSARVLQKALVGSENQSRRTGMSRGSTVRPGSPVYLQVRDFDQNVSAQRDTVTVSIKTSSGDVVDAVVLTETGEHTGLFRGKVDTGVPAPRATASDSEEGKSPSVLINSTQPGRWVSRADGKKGKWVEVDTQSSYLFRKAVLKMPNAERISSIRLDGLLSGDEYIPLGALPAQKNRAKGGVRRFDVYGNAGSIQGMRNLITRERRRNTSWVGVHQSDSAYSRELTKWNGKRGWVVSQLMGAFYLESPQVLDLKLLQTTSHHNGQMTYLFIDGRRILGGRYSQNASSTEGTVSLGEGVHLYELLVCDEAIASQVMVGVGQDDGSYSPLPAAWFDPQEQLELAEYLKPIATITRAAEGFTADFKGDRRIRKLRWVFEDFGGNGVEAEAITLIDDQGSTIIPVKVDFSTAMANRTLEIAPGDRIEVTYEDVYTRRGDVALLSANLNATYADGTIAASEEVIRDLGAGNMRSTYFKAMRYRLGDQFAITVKDNDLDLTPQADTIPVTVTTASGEQLSLQALEKEGRSRNGTNVHSGVFQAILKTGLQTDSTRDTIKAGPGEIITFSYKDMENSDPGVPFDRTYSVMEAGSGSPDVSIYRTSTCRVEDTSRAAKEKLERMKRKGKEVEGFKILRSEIIARHPDYVEAATAESETSIESVVPDGEQARVSINAPLLFEVIYPSQALHAGSTIKAYAVTGRERAAAQAEEREVNWLELDLRLSSIGRSIDGTPVQLITNYRRSDDSIMQDGLFSGCIRLQIGAPGDPIDTSRNGRGHDDGFVDSTAASDSTSVARPTLVVTGSDSVTIRFKDESKDTDTEASVRLVSEGRLTLMDQTYAAEVATIHMGQSFYLQLNDPDQDISDDLDCVKVVAKAAKTEDSTTVILTETLPHSGVFTGKITPTFLRTSAPAVTEVSSAEEAVSLPPTVPVDPLDSLFHVKFGEAITFTYTDTLTLIAGETKAVKVLAQIHLGDNGSVSGFTKHFSDPEMAVKVRFLWAEALFEMAKGLRKLEKGNEAKLRISEGELILQEALRDYPNTKLKAQGAFLLANLAQELASDEEDEAKQKALYEKAIVKYANIASTWPECDQAARSVYKKALCLERLGNMDPACEEYVRLTYTYPDHPLVSEAVLRLGGYYLRIESYGVAARIFGNFAQQHTLHPMAAKALFLSAQAHIKAAVSQPSMKSGKRISAKSREHYDEAVDVLQRLVDDYKDDKRLRAEAMYWLGDSSFKIQNYRLAYITLKTLTFEYPESAWAKRARGYLTDGVFSEIKE